MNLEYQLFLFLILCCVLMLVLPVGSVYWFFIHDDTSVNLPPNLIMQVTGGGQTIGERRKTTNQLYDSSISYDIEVKESTIEKS